MRAERSLEIGRGQKRVWEVLADPSLLPVWFEDVDDFVMVEGDGQSVGDIYRVNYTRFRKPLGLKVAVVEAETERLLVQRFTGLLAPFTISCALSGSSRKTTLDAFVDVKLSLLQKPFTPVVSGYIDQLAISLTNGFRSYVEDGGRS